MNLKIIDSTDLSEQNTDFFLNHLMTVARIEVENTGVNQTSELIFLSGLSFVKAIEENKMIILLCVDENNNLIGYSVLHLLENSFFLSSIFVANNLRNKGIGSFMLDYINQATSNIHAFSFKENLSFFKKKGFIVTKKLKADFCPNDARIAHNDIIYHIKKGFIPEKVIKKIIKQHREIAGKFL